MPSFCIPCWPSKAPSHFDELEIVSVHDNKSDNPAEERNVLAKPSSAEYTGEAAKEFLDALESVAGLIPLPGVATAVKTAKKIIQACDDTHATLERAEELKSRIKKLVTILVDELKEKTKAEEIQAKLQEDIQSLSKDLEYIQRKLDDIASQNALLLIVFRRLNDEKVKECVDRLDNSLANFNLVRQINDGKLLNTLEKGILDFHTSHRKTLNAIALDVNEIKAILQGAHDPASSSSPRAAIPPNTSIFHGRDTLVEKLVGILTSNSDGQKRPRVCLLGPGGMGKTSTALAVMADPKMIQHFPKKNQIWVPCVKATSLSQFRDTLYSSLGTSQNSGDALADVIFEINSSAEPLVLLLDNFETPWNVQESQSETERILDALDQIAHITILITMRSSMPPRPGKQWQPFNIEEVDEKAARQIYLDICPTSDDDSKLSELLKALGHMPLAITLIATMAKSIGLGADKLMENYQRKGPAMVGHGKDATHSLDICISLSVKSPPMTNCPDAYKLLVSLAMLPAGAMFDVLDKWWARNSPNLIGELDVLAETALITQRGDHYYFVHPVIRSYVLDPSRFPSNIRSAMIASACDILKQHNSSPGDPSFKEHAMALSAEEGNLQAILLNVTNPEPGLIEALLVLAEHQLSTRPRLEVIEHALKLARLMESHPKLVGEVRTCYGKILQNLDRYDDAMEQHTLARKTFLSIQSEQLAARSSLCIVDAYSWMPDTVAGAASQKKLGDLIMQAKSVFEKHDDGPGVALSLYYLGTVYAQHGPKMKGIDFLNRALDIFKDRGDALYQAKCLYYLEVIYYWDRRYDDALKAGKDAVQRYEALGQYSGDPIGMLGTILFMKGDYPNALEMSVRALEICKSYGRPRAIAQTLEVIGRIWAKMDRQESAQGAYMEAMRYYGTILHAMTKERGMTRSKFLTRQAEDPSLDPTPQERSILQCTYEDFQLPEDD